MNRLTETAPERIWLHATDSGTPEITCTGASWFCTAPNGAVVEYVRADLLDAAQKRIAELEVEVADLGCRLEA